MVAFGLWDKYRGQCHRVRDSTSPSHPSHHWACCQIIASRPPRLHATSTGRSFTDNEFELEIFHSCHYGRKIIVRSLRVMRRTQCEQHTKMSLINNSSNRSRIHFSPFRWCLRFFSPVFPAFVRDVRRCEWIFFYNICIYGCHFRK